MESLEVQWAVPQDVEAHAGQLWNQSDQRPGQPFMKQILTLLEAIKQMAFGELFQIVAAINDVGFEEG